MGTANKGSPEKIDTQNIFDEFSTTQNIQEEVQKVDIKVLKDIYFYIKKISSAFLVLNIVLFLGIILSVFYIYIQEGETKKEYGFLKPVCGLFLGNAQIGGNTCYGVIPLLSEHQKLLEDEIQNTSQKVIPLIEQVYSIENFNFSQRAKFLLQKSDERLQVLEILTSFDELKTKFAPRDKSEISCYDIVIGQGDTMQLTCDIFSSDWDKSITQTNDGSLLFTEGGGTSISRASSFVDFLSSYENSSFDVLDKPKTYSTESVQNGPYTKKTTIQLELRYSNIQELTF